MDTKDYKVIEILGDQKRFVVPIYQRQFSWRRNRLEPFWDDIAGKAEEALESAPKFSHYMGALILAPGSDGYKIGATPKVQVVDGQQRLTSFQIFLAALRDIGQSLGFPDIGKSVHNYIFNNPMTGDSDKEAIFKLVPTPEDKKVFHLLMQSGLEGVRAKHPEYFFKNGKVIWKDAPRAVRAFSFFSERIDQFARLGVRDEDEPSDEPQPEEGKAAQGERLQALLAAVLSHMKLVVITLDEGDDAQVIFETLNSKAEPLLAMDLVRNNIFHRATAQGESAEVLFEEKWKPFDAPFWKEDAPRAKPKRPRIDHFLSHALTAQSGQETSLRELYAEYRAFTRPKGKTRFASVEHELDALLNFVPPYRALEEGVGDPLLINLGRKLAIWDVSTAHPLIFAIATSEADPSVKGKLYDLIYSYLVRRAICGLTSKGLNKTFQRLVDVMIKEGVSLEKFRSAFSAQTGDAVRFPNDDEFKGAVLAKPVYAWFNRKERLAEVLWELETATRDKFSVNTAKPGSMSIEHVLPQTWMPHWPLADGRLAPEDKITGADETMLAAITNREAALHTLGNLTLITVPANTVASNSEFKVKAPWLKKSLLALNLEIVDQTNWDESKIAARSKSLADRAVSVWPFPND